MVHSFFLRFAASIVTLIAILLLTFLLLHLIPGGPFDQERQLPPEIEKNLYQKYGLSRRGDQNFFSWLAKDLKSYAGYLKKGELGPSLKYRDRDVSEMIAKALPASFKLGALAFLFSLVLGISLGLFVSKNPGNTFDKFLSAFSSLIVSIPSFVLAMILVFFFSQKWRLLPPALWEGIPYQVLPVLVLSLPIAVFLAQLTKVSILEEMKKDFIRTAHAKGVSANKILFKHGFRNAASPLLSVLGPTAAYLITGSFVVETLFAIPGLGRHFVTAVIDRDLFLVMGITLVYSVVLIVINWGVDLGYGLLDPRVRKK